MWYVHTSLTNLVELLLQNVFLVIVHRAPLERTKLHDAAKRGEVKRVQRLLSTGSLNINSRTVIVSISIMASVDTIIMYYMTLQLLAVAGVGLTLTKVFLSPQKNISFLLHPIEKP